MKKVVKKKQGVFRIFSWILSILILVVAGILLWQIVTLGMLPTNLLVGAFILVVLIAVLAVILQLFCTRTNWSRIILTLLNVCMLAICSLGSWYIYKANTLVQDVTGFQTESTNTVQVIALKDSPLNSAADLQGQTVGTLANIAAASTEAITQDLAGQGISFNSHPYGNIEEMVNALYSQEVPAIILNDSYRNSVLDLENERFINFNQETKIIYSYQYNVQVQTTTKTVEAITDTPFSVLISGVDSRFGFAERSRSDVNMIATINPKTRVILLTSIPRDYYVTTACDPEAGCQNGALDKLTHTGLHGTETTKMTIENLLGIEINYTAKVNFTSVVNLVDALGGIDVDVKPGYAVEHFYTNDYFGTDYGVHVGINHLNGQMALCYARERYAYAEGDRQRVKNQQEVLMAITKKATSPSVIVNYPALMDALSGAFQTDLSSDEIQSLIQFQLKEAPDWTFITYSLDGTGATDFCAELGNNAYVMIPDPETVNTAKSRIDAVLAGQSAEEVEAIGASGQQ